MTDKTQNLLIRIFMVPMIIFMCAGVVMLHERGICPEVVEAIRHIPTVPAPWFPGYGPFGL